MAIFVDIVGAAVIVGILFLSIFGMNLNLNQANYNKTFSLITQTNAVALARMIEYDFVKMGYHSTKPFILAATAASITFKAYLRNVGTVNTVQYYVGPSSALGTTKNPRDFMVYRVEDGNVIAANLGLTSLSLTYFDKDGFTTLAPDSIMSIDVKFTVESPEPADTSYAAAFWEKRIYPKNL